MEQVFFMLVVGAGEDEVVDHFRGESMAVRTDGRFCTFDMEEVVVKCGMTCL